LASKLLVGVIATAILFIVGVIMLSNFNMFSENWLIGIGLITAAMGVIAITIYVKAKS
jgi:phosphatidylserine synthase